MWPAACAPCTRGVRLRGVSRALGPGGETRRWLGPTHRQDGVSETPVQTEGSGGWAAPTFPNPAPTLGGFLSGVEPSAVQRAKGSELVIFPFTERLIFLQLKEISELSSLRRGLGSW